MLPQFSPKELGVITDRRTIVRLAGLMLLAAGLVVVWDAPGTHDVVIWQRWMTTLEHSGLFAGYRDIVLNQRQDYPPLSVALLWLASNLAGGASFLALKALLALGWVASLMILALLRPAYWLWFVYAAFSLYSALALGYLDVLIAPFAFAAAAAIRSKGSQRFAWTVAGMFVAMACAVKWQPLLWMPFIAVALWKVTQDQGDLARGRQRLIAFCTGLFSVVLVGVLAFGPLVCLQSLRLVFAHTALSADALNLGWVFQDLAHRVDPSTYGPLVPGIRPIIWTPGPWLYWTLRCLQAGALGFSLFLAMSARQDWPRAIGRAAALGCASYFFLGPGLHENHLFPAVIALLLLAIHDRSSRKAFAAITLFQAVNLAVFYGFDGLGFSSLTGSVGTLGGMAPQIGIVGVDLPLVFAWIGVALYVWTWTQLAGRQFTDSTVSSSPETTRAARSFPLGWLP